MKAWKIVLFLLFAIIVFVILAFSQAPATKATSPGPGLEAPPPGGALVWYLGHCGFAVRTRDHFLIFDYQEERDGPQPKTKPARPSLASGWIDPEEIKGLKVRVFVSHSHGDHYDPVIYSWRQAVPDILYYFGWRAGDDPRDAYLVGPRAELESGGFQIATINSHHAGVPEVAWLVKVDGLAVYHNGDCQPPDPAAGYAFLRTKTEAVDLAFLPPVTAPGEKYTIQERDFFTKFRVGAAFPMHFNAGAAMYREFKRAFEAEFPGLVIYVPEAMGEKFVYRRYKGPGGRGHGSCTPTSPSPSSPISSRSSQACRSRTTCAGMSSAPSG
jgi:L-ascorbate metabolism protein UlaG (beta-lactamase superfamily)